LVSEDERDGAERLDEIRLGIASRLKSRTSEIDQAIYARVVSAVPDPVASEDRTYRASMREAISEVVAYGLTSIERGPEWAGPIPAAAVAQARLAARVGVGLGTVLRRYVAGHGELGDFVMREAEACGLSNHGSALHQIRRTQELLLERITAAIEHEYNQERERVARSPEQRRGEIVQSILGGLVSPNDLAELDYDIYSMWHVGLIASGVGAGEALDELKAYFGRRVLLVLIDGVLWAWLRSQTRPTEKDVERASIERARLSLGVGEPGLGLDGWRLSHYQARAALALALRRTQGLARYGDDRLLAAALENDTLARSLRQKYLTPLCSQRDGGAKLRRTLRTYIDLDCNATSAAEVLEVGRRAVTSRVCAAEKLIGCALSDCLAELDVALRLGQLDLAPAGTDVASMR
jgi:hypothetical protein